ncbi:MAG: hypothetical protein WD648_16345 [Planctomycetaceae bacterium]
MPEAKLEPQTTSIVTEPVDRMGLANNLYATGNYKLALETYRSIPLAEINTDERVWIEYQLACCHRNLGDLSEAEKHYRVVASRAQPEYLSENARWWLHTLQKRKELEQSLEQFHSALDAMEKQINVSKTESTGT